MNFMNTGSKTQFTPTPEVFYKTTGWGRGGDLEIELSAILFFFNLTFLPYKSYNFKERPIYTSPNLKYVVLKSVVNAYGYFPLFDNQSFYSSS